MRHAALLSSALLLASLLGACQDEKPAAGNGRPDSGFDWPDSGDQGPFAILIVEPEEIEGQVTTRHTLAAHVFASTGIRVPNMPVRFAITSENPGNASLSDETVFTDERGRAENSLYLGTSPGQLTVQVSLDGYGQPVLVQVRVIDYPTGRLQVTLEGVGPARIGPIEIFVMPGTNRCPYNPIVQPFGELKKTTLPTVNETTDFDAQQFIANQPVTIWARGMCGNASLRTMAATGCQDGVIIPANDTARVTLTMVVKPLQTVGTYDVVGRYDFTGAIPGVAGDVIERLDVLFGDRNIAEFLIYGIQSLIEAFFDNIIVEVIFWVIDQVQDIAEPWINDWILSVAPDWLLDFLTVGDDLLQIVTHLELIQVTRFDKTGSDFTVAGTEEWVGIALYWRLNCDEGSPPDCGRYEFNMEDLLQAEEPIEAVYATFNARATNFNQLVMDPHNINLQYGRLILFVLNNVVLPLIADGARSISEALINLIDCEGLAWSITGNDGEWGGSYRGIDVGFDVDDAIGWCEGAANLLGDTATNLLEALSFDSVLAIEGSCELQEDDMDLMVDRLENGHYRGWILVDGQRGDQEFRGTWRGDRRLGSR